MISENLHAWTDEEGLDAWRFDLTETDFAPAPVLQACNAVVSRLLVVLIGSNLSLPVDQAKKSFQKYLHTAAFDIL
jgi:hypothetical protein